MNDDPSGPLIPTGALTRIWDDQVSFFDELLGDPLALVATPEAGGALTRSTSDPRATIRPHTGTESLSVGWTPDEVRAALGGPEDVTDLELDLGLEGFGITWHYYGRGLEVEFKQGHVARLTFHTGRYSGGLVPRNYGAYEGALEFGTELLDLREEEISARLGEPDATIVDDVELAALLDERPARKLIYPGWTFTVYNDGSLESVSVPVHYVPQ